MVPNVIERVWVQGTTTKVESLRGTAFTEEDGAHTFRITGVDASGETVPLSGTVLAKVLRSDNITIDVSGTITDGVVSVTMVGDCYHVPGRFSIVVYLSDGVTTIAIYAAVGDIYRATSDTELDSGTTVPSLVQLEAAYQNALSATTAANTAATGAERVNVSMSKSGGTITFSTTDRTGATITETLSDQSEDVADLKIALTPLNNNVITESAGPAPIVSIKDGADGMPLRSLSVAVEPVQDLHGYDHPWPDGGGKNKYNADALTPLSTNGITATVSNGEITLNGTATAGAYFGVPCSISVLNSVTMRVGNPVGNTAVHFAYRRPNGSYFGDNRLSNANYLVTVSGQNEIDNILFYVEAGTTISNFKIKPLLLIDDTTTTEWTPYSNICPITGWTGANVTRTGKNLYDYATSHVSSGGTFSLITNGFRFTGNRAYQSTKGMFNDFIGGQTYTVSAHIKANVVDENYRPRIAIRSDTNAIIAQVSLEGSGAGEGDLLLTYTPQTNITAYISVIGTGGSPSATIDIECTNIQLELGSTATAYEPYQGKTYDITFPSQAGTVYGGTLDVASGKLVVDRKMIDFDKTANWIKSSATACDTYVVDSIASIMSQFDLSKGGESNVAVVSSANVNDSVGTILIKATQVRFGFAPYGATTLQDFKNWLDDKAVQLNLYLATPVEYALTPQEITTLLGANNIWDDTGDTTVTYPADTKLYIDSKIAELQALVLENNG